MARSGRKRRLRNSNETNSAEADDVAKAAKAASNKVSKKGLKCHYYSTDDDESQTHVLDGVEYKNYNDFVEAKRKRNEAYLQTLGFDSHKTTTATTESEPSKQNTPENKEEEIQNRRIVSPPASFYYERFEMGEMSLDGASLTTDPFDQISKLLVALEEEIKKVQNLPAVAKESKEKSKLAILSLLERILSHLSPSNKNYSLREKHLEAFHQLDGVDSILWVLDPFSSYDYENLDILGLCLDILRDACCVSVGAKSKNSASEKVALALTQSESEPLELLVDFLYKTVELMDHDASKSKSRKNSSGGRSQARSSVNGTPEKHSESPEERRRNTLATMSKAWGIFVNLTYFESVTKLMKGWDDWEEDEDSTMNRLVYVSERSLYALDDHVTQDLAKILPLPPSLEQKTPAKRGRPKKNSSPKSKEIAPVSPEAIEKCRSIAMEASRILEPILGTIRNIIADPSSSSNYWEIKCFVPMILNIICKGQEDEVTQPQINSNESDWLHFVTQIGDNIVRKNPPPPIMFRWMEQSETAVLEILGIFKVCLDKGVLCTHTNDVERLVGFCVRCLRHFGTSSSRTTLCILGLVEGLVTPSGNGTYGLSSTKARIQKQILLRKGFLDELENLSGRYSSLHACGSLPLNGERVRFETQSLIAKLRVIE